MNATNGIRPVRMQISDVRGIHDYVLEISDPGVRIEARNEGGKSTLVDAMRALLGGREMTGDDVRNGADRARISGELSDGTKITRTIPRDGAQRLVVIRDGAPVAKPQEFLDALVGGVAAFDPGKFLAADPREQARMVGEAIPCALTAAHLAAWGIEGSHDLSGHGLAALGRVRLAVEAARTNANAEAKVFRAEADVAKREADEIGDLDAPTVADAEQQARDAALAHAEMLRQVAEATRRVEQNETTWARIHDLRKIHDHAIAQSVGPDAATVRGAADELAAARRTVAEIEASLADAKAAAADAERRANELAASVRIAAAFGEKAKATLAECVALEAAIGGPLAYPDGATIAAAAASKAEADETLALARAAEQAFAVRHGAAQKAERADTAEARAAYLQGRVDHLRDKAPAELVQGGIAGVELTDRGVMVDGIPLAKLSTSKRMEIAVRVAILRSPKAGWVQVDNLEAFDPDHAAELIAHVHAAGRAFVGAIVSRSDLRVVPIDWTALPASAPHPEPDAPAADADVDPASFFD